jgi:MFS family permease
MKNRQLRILFACNLCVFITGNGLLPLMPVYATELGAAPTLIGGLMAFAYLTLAGGTMMTRRLLDVFGSPRHLLVSMALICALVSLLLGHISVVWQLAIVLAVLWFCGGAIAALIAVLTGLNTVKANRGRVFGLMYLAMPLGALIGGTTIGRLVDGQGYTFMFSVLSVLWFCVAIIGLAGIRSPKEEAAGQLANPVKVTEAAPNSIFRALLAAVFLSSISVFVGRLATSLMMQSLHFSAGAITEATAIGALMVIPMVPLIGDLSDRLGRWGVLSVCYGLGAIGILILSISMQAWHFWIATVCLSIATYIGNSIATALAADLLRAETLNKGLPRLNAMTWIGGIAGFGMTGYLLETMGTAFVLGGASLFSLIAVLLLKSQFRYEAIRQVLKRISCPHQTS